LLLLLLVQAASGLVIVKSRIQLLRLGRDDRDPRAAAVIVEFKERSAVIWSMSAGSAVAEPDRDAGARAE
jgi:hypothetical protein